MLGLLRAEIEGAASGKRNLQRRYGLAWKQGHEIGHEHTRSEVKSDAGGEVSQPGRRMFDQISLDALVETGRDQQASCDQDGAHHEL